MISGIMFEVNIVTTQKPAWLATIFLFFISFHCSQLFHIQNYIKLLELQRNQFCFLCVLQTWTHLFLQACH